MSQSKKSIEELLYLTDERNNVICVPNSPENMRKMANELGLKKTWLKKDHYQIPDDVFVENISDKCSKVSSTTLFRALHGIM